MKPSLIIPPVVALIVAGWAIGQRRTITVLEKETTVLRQQLAARPSAAAGDSSPGKPAAPAKAAKDKDAIDWKELAAKMSEMRGMPDMSNMREMMRFQKRLMTMSRDELAAALEEIDALDLPGDGRMALESMLIGPLVQKDPQFALTRFAGRLNDDHDGIGWQLAGALREWAKKDSAAATAWMDQQVAAGTFDSKSLDGKSRVRVQFEGTLISALLATDPAAAAARLGSLPADQRAEAAGNFGVEMVKDEDQAAFADLVRSQVPADEQARTIAQTAMRMAWNEDGYEKVSAFLERINATPAERAASVEQAAETRIQMLSQNSKITRETIDAMRVWATAEAPEAADKVTGQALARSTEVNQKLEYGEAAAMALQYHESSGNDEVLIGFLDSGSSWRNKEQARALAEKITDEKRRHEILKRFQ